MSSTLERVPVVVTDYVFADRSIAKEASAGCRRTDNASSSWQRREAPVERLKKAAIITRLIERLRERGSWCGETHVQGLFAETLAHYEPRLAFIAERLGAKGVTELKGLATAYWVTTEHCALSEADRALRVTKIKPHISLAEAEAAIAAVDDMAHEATSIVR